MGCRHFAIIGRRSGFIDHLLHFDPSFLPFLPHPIPAYTRFFDMFDSSANEIWVLMVVVVVVVAVVLVGHRNYHHHQRKLK